MKLATQTWSERGKQVLKTGNEYIKINVLNEKRALIAYIEINEGVMKVTVPTNKILEPIEHTYQLR